jgi:hypothetical protein
MAKVKEPHAKGDVNIGSEEIIIDCAKTDTKVVSRSESLTLEVYDVHGQGVHIPSVVGAQFKFGSKGKGYVDVDVDVDAKAKAPKVKGDTDIDAKENMTNVKCDIDIDAKAPKITML